MTFEIFKQIVLDLIKTLEYLQSEFQFNHNDLHLLNVLYNTTNKTTYLIDFDFSSLTIEHLRITAKKT